MKWRKSIFLYLIALFVVIAFGCSEIFEPSLNNVKVIQSIPIDSAISDTTRQTFSWQTVVGANQYELQVVSPSFDSAVSLLADTILTNPFFSTNLVPGKYQWKVRAFNYSTTTAFSANWSFTVQ